MDPLVGLLIGLLAGFASGLLGIGGGIIMVPSLILIGVDPHVAIATSLVAIIIITSSGSATHWRLGHVRPRVVAMLAVPAILGTQIGAIASINTPADTIKLIYGVFLLILAYRFLHTRGPLKAGTARSNPIVIIPYGFLVGILAAFLGIGGGIVMVLFMMIYMGFDIRHAVGTSSAVIVITATAATARYVHLGVPDIAAGIAIGVAGAVTAIIGARATISISRESLRRVFGVFLLIIGLRFLGLVDAITSMF